MRIGMVGLGRMGGNMVRRLARQGVGAVVYDREAKAVAALVAEGAEGAQGLADLAQRLTPPRTVWLMVPDTAVDDTLAELVPHLDPGDTVVDGGNSHYRDSVRRHEALAAAGLSFVDVGVSGGVWGLEHGYCLMAGGSREAVERLWPLFSALAPQGGVLHTGPAGSGHFVKMVHNGIEYGMLQALAEGFELLSAKGEFGLDLAAVARVWQHGSVIRSWLLELTAAALARDPRLSSLEGFVADSGEGRWTVQEAVSAGVPVPAISAALFARFFSREQGSFAAKLIAALRQEFGGHPVRREEDR